MKRFPILGYLHSCLQRMGLASSFEITKWKSVSDNNKNHVLSANFTEEKSCSEKNVSEDHSSMNNLSHFLLFKPLHFSSCNDFEAVVKRCAVIHYTLWPWSQCFYSTAPSIIHVKKKDLNKSIKDISRSIVVDREYTVHDADVLAPVFLERVHEADLLCD